MSTLQFPETLPYEVSHDFLWDFVRWESDLGCYILRGALDKREQAEFARLRRADALRVGTRRLRHDELLRLIRLPAARNHPHLAYLGVLELARRYDEGEMGADAVGERVAEIRRIWAETERRLHEPGATFQSQISVSEFDLAQVVRLTGRI